MAPSTASDRAIYYEVDPNTNPATWPGHIPTDGSHTAIHKVDVMYFNINGHSDDTIHHVLTQVTKHVARGLYRILSMNMSEYSCVVVMSTELPRQDLMWKNGFPWDREDDPQPEVVLK